MTTKRPRNSAPLTPGRACDMIMAIRASRDQRISDRTAEIAQEVDAAIDRKVKSLVDRVDPELRGQLSRMLAAAQSEANLEDNPHGMTDDELQRWRAHGSPVPAAESESGEQIPASLMTKIEPVSGVEIDREKNTSRRVGSART